jgi:hypothetical protein
MNTDPVLHIAALATNGTLLIFGTWIVATIGMYATVKLNQSRGK